MASQANAIPMGGTAEYGIWRVILASAVGTMIEWYDFYIFGSLAAVLSPIFYPPGNQTFSYRLLGHVRCGIRRAALWRALFWTDRRHRGPQVCVHCDVVNYGWSNSTHRNVADV